MQDMNRSSKLLSTFKIKIEEAVALVPNMVAEEKLKAVQFWNVVSEKLQEIVNNSAADISALAFELEKESAIKVPDGTTISLTDVSDKTHRDSQHLVAGEHTAGAILTQPLVTVQSHQLSAYGNAPDVGTTSAIQLTSHGLVLPPDEHMSQSLVLTSANETMQLSHPLPDSELVDHRVSTEVSARPSGESESAVQMEAEPRIFQPELVSQNDLSEPLGELGSELTVSSKNLQAKKISSCRKTSKEDVWCPTTESAQPDDVEWKLSNTQSKLTRKKKATNGEPSNPRRQPPRNSRWKNFTLSAEKDCISLDAEDTRESWNVDNNDTTDRSEAGSEVNNEHNNDNTDLKGKPGDKGPVLTKSVKVSKKKKNAANCDSRLSDETEIVDIADATMTGNSCQTKPHFCTECDARFATRGNLIVHCRRHTGEKPYACPQCNAKFSTRGNLKRHIKTHSGEKPWHCSQCGGSFTEKKSLKVHMRKHTGEKPYQCNVCGKRFAQTGILQTHMAMHMDQKEHLCEHCGKSFRQKSQLQLHMMRHEGLRKHQCLTCPAKFLTKGDLDRHNRVHTGERPYVCELCGRTFTRQQSLKEHMNRHYGLKPYQCKYCGKCFAEMSACYKHIKQHERSQNFEGRDEPGCQSDSEAGDLETSGTVVEAVESSDSEHKFGALAQVGVSVDEDVAENEVVVESREAKASAESRSRAADFTAINLLACASSFQQNF